MRGSSRIAEEYDNSCMVARAVTALAAAFVIFVLAALLAGWYFLANVSCV